MFCTLYFDSLVLSGMGYVLNVICILEMRYLSKTLIANPQRKKSSSEKPGHSKDENTTLGYVEIKCQLDATHILTTMHGQNHIKQHWDFREVGCYGGTELNWLWVDA